jgi:hypothetical protein
VLGIPISYKDINNTSVFYDPVLNKDEDSRVPLMSRSSFNSSNFWVPIQTDFTERQFQYRYNGLSDVMGSIGGLNAFIKPILGYATPYFILIFMYMLSRIIWHRYEKDFHYQAIEFLKNSRVLLYKKVPDQATETDEFRKIIFEIDDFIAHEKKMLEELRDTNFKTEVDQDEFEKDLDED